MFGKYTYEIFLISGYLSLLFLVFAFLVLIFPEFFRLIQIFNHLNRKNSIWLFLIAGIFFLLCQLAIPEGFP
jgi:hypothetical protein